MDSQGNKPHRQAGRKSSKQKLQNAAAAGRNPRAFAVSAPGKMHRTIQRSADVTERKYHVPMVTRLPEDEEPPVIVGVVGPSGVGKSTLIKSLVKRFSKTNVSEIQGPITLVSGKRRRLTIIEVKPDLNSMIDAAKIVDLVLLMIDGNYGLEMETFEFLNIAQHHGMPKVIGCVTHCDLFKSESTLRAQKKVLKHRFWTEVYKGAKLFYLSGIINGRYPDREILNLSRFVSVMKFRPLKWRNDHSYLLIDRVNDLTNPMDITNNPKIDRKVAMYGYVHGTNLRQGAAVHITGSGDFTIGSVEKLPDPVPSPYIEQKINEIEIEEAKLAAANGEAIVLKRPRRKRLEEKQKIIYAPMSDIGGVLIDKDAVYIDVGTKHHGEGKLVDEDKDKEQESQLLEELSKKKSTDAHADFGVQLFTDGSVLQGSDEENEEVENSNDELLSDLEDDAEVDEAEKGNRGRSSKRQIRQYGDSKRHEKEELELQEDSEFELSEDEMQGLKSSALKLQGKFGARKANINSLIYNLDLSAGQVVEQWNGESSEDDEEDEEGFFSKKVTEIDEEEDSSLPKFDDTETLKEKWDSQGEAFEKLKKKYFFVSPREKLRFKSREEVKKEREEDGNSSEDDFADFDKEEDEEDEEDEEEEEEDEDEENLSVSERRAKIAKKKSQLKLQYEAEEDEFGKNQKEELNEYESWYEFQKAKMAKQLEINKAEVEKLDEATQTKIDGYKAGSYVKITFDSLPCESIENFDPSYPVIVGGLLATEMNFGILNARIRKHRWHKKILKSNDPLILSLGWRRFQTLPIYSTSDSRTRTRMLKYTPEHAYCQVSFYGPLVTPNTTFCGAQIVSNSETGGGFRISATGIIEEVNSSVEIVKKLKLVGYPYKIFKNTAFIKDMFSTSLEVVKFEGAAIKTVSGIRGEIKRALSQPDGNFRATFEDKVKLSDIIFLKTWYPVKIKHFYNPITSLLMKDKAEWTGMRLTGKIRADANIETPSNPNSEYSKIERHGVKFNPLQVSKRVQSDLPFKSQIARMKPQKNQTYLQKRAVLMNGDEKKSRTLLQQLNTIKKEKDSKKKAKKQEKTQERIKKLNKAEKEKQDRLRDKKREYFTNHKGHTQGGGASKKRRV